MKISGHGLESIFTFSSPDSEGWMKTIVQIRAPKFEGNFSCTVEKKEWSSFIQTLRHLEASVGENVEASWGNMEENIEFHFALHKNGALEVVYKFSPENFSLGPTLSGMFTADQTFLQSWVKSGEEVLENAR
ncbi:WapI family immunity protein [Methylobacter luteus]|uniref:WapI family immunity protein n=1 Tax=Methylobacter luteus TaxID=415 RepID=UPI00047F7084|nr:hypothetical protein [Methylobacter luteus]